MKNPSLKDLPGFPSSYVGFVEAVSAPGHTSLDYPEKDLLLSRCKAVSGQVSQRAVVPEIMREEAPIAAGSHSWLQNAARLEDRSAVVVGASADDAGFSTSLVPMLKCLTAIKLASEISHEGIPAVPLLWVNLAGHVARNNAKNGGRLEPLPPGTQQDGGPRSILIKYLNKTSEPSLKNDLYRDSTRRILACLIHEFGLVAVDSKAIGLRLAHSQDLEGLRRTITGLDVRKFEGRTPLVRAGEDSTIQGMEKAGLPGALLLRLSLPVAVEVVGPEDLATAALLGDLIGALGTAKPFLWPRISATIVDGRSRKIMEKFGVELPDLLKGSSVLPPRLEFDRSASEVTDRLEALAGNVEARVAGVSTRACGDPRAVRRVQAAGSKIRFQLRKLAVRSRLSAETQHETAARQLEGLCSRIVPGGELQEQSMSAMQLLSVHSESILPVLFRKIDVWDLNHQLIGLD